MQRLISATGRFSILVILLLGLVGCGDKNPNITYPVEDFPPLEAPAELQDAMDAAWQDLRTTTSRLEDEPDLVDYFRLSDLVNSPALADSACALMTDLWRSDPGNPFLIRLAERRFKTRLPDLFADILNDTTVADSHTWRGRMALAMRTEDLSERAAHLDTAMTMPGERTPLEQAWLRFCLVSSRECLGPPDEALSSLLTFLPSARAAHPALTMFIWRWIGYELDRLGHLDQSLHAHLLALNLACYYDTRYFVCNYLQQFTTDLIRMEKSDLALPLLDEAVAYAEGCGLNGFIYDYLTYKASIFASRNEQEKALAVDKEVVARAIAAGDSLRVVMGLANISSIYQTTTRLDSFRVYVKRAELWGRCLHNPVDRVQMATYSVEYESHIGNYAAVDSLLDMSMRLLGDDAPPYLRVLILCRMIRHGRVSGQPEVAYRAIDDLQVLGSQVSDVAADYSLVTGAETSIAEFLGWQSEHQLAREALARAREAARVHGNEYDAWHVEKIAFELAIWSDDLPAAYRAAQKCMELAQSWKQDEMVLVGHALKGRYYLARADYDSALVQFALAGDENSDDPNFRTVLSNLIYSGVAYSRLGHYDEARAIFRRAAAYYGENAPADLEARLLLEESRVARNEGQPARAERDLQRALSVLNNARRRPGLEGLLVFHTNLVRQVTEDLIDLYLAHPELAGAEGAALRTLRLAEACRWAGSAAGGGDTVGRASPVNAVPFDAGLPDLDPTRVEIPTLAYFVGQDHSYVWCVADGGVAVRRLPGKTDLRRAVTPVLAAYEADVGVADETALQDLSRLLLGPIAEVWAPDGVLRIIPDDLLLALPWYGLVLDGPDGSVEPLLDYGEIIEGSTVAAGMFATAAESRTDGSDRGRLLAVGVNAESSDAAGASVPLRYAEQEAREITNLWAPNPVKLALGAEASWSQLKKLDLSSFSVIHVATHSAIYQGQSGQSVLRLGLGDAAEPLSMSEVSTTDFNADLVFLSCCEAARVVNKTGGAANFAQAFLAAGVRAVVASVHTIEDEAARYLAGRFYRHWLAGASASTALRQALLDLRGARPEWQHPSNWAFYCFIVN